MTIADRLNKIIKEQNITKVEFARRVGITENYIYILTGKGRPDKNQNRVISPILENVIAMEIGYDENWVLNGDDEVYI